MIVQTCKKCGGNVVLESENVKTIGICEFCGTRTTVAKIDEDQAIALYNRANKYRETCDFENASEIYEELLLKNNSSAEAHFGLVLCNYGVEYVKDDSTGKYKPTLHTVNSTPIADDVEYNEAIRLSDGDTRAIYERDAREIQKILDKYLAIAASEKPYDIFISYRHNDDRGLPTLDSGIAQKIYKELKNKGYNAFFSKISLEDKLGSEYEPYIFSALLAAKVMIVVGSSNANMNSKWVKNEWHRFLAQTMKDHQKRLIACFIDMDVYDLPREFAALQSQDMRKVSALDDLVTSIDKIFGKNDSAHVNAGVSEIISTFSSRNAELKDLIENGYVYLDQENFGSATREFNRALDLKPNSADAYLGMVLSDARSKDFAEFKSLFNSRYMGFLYESTVFQRFVQYASGAQRNEIVELLIGNEKRELAKYKSVQDDAINSGLDAHSKLADYTLSEMTEVSEKYQNSNINDKNADNVREILDNDAFYIDELISDLERDNEKIKRDVLAGDW
ncbi:MAG: toll/interleukin-1 receptor domain-containing protein [Bifidobacteriaceae bacterium]|jgi:peroxiredoxin family protein|nr:toll/interleukin-1 receptor domain-containing protein [Bifidobacteriaceae bacterium]